MGEGWGYRREIASGTRPRGTPGTLSSIRLLLAFDDVGLGIPLQEALERLGHEVHWRPDTARGPTATLGLVPDVVLLSADAAAADLPEIADQWRHLDPAPGLIALGVRPDLAHHATAARVAYLASTAAPAELDRAAAEAERLRFTTGLSLGLARRALQLPADANVPAVIAAARGLDAELARSALRWHAQHYVTATSMVDDLRSVRALIVPEIEQLAHMNGAATVQTVVRQGPLDGYGAARLIWVLASIGTVTLTAEPPDAATPARRAVVELRAHLRARQKRLARGTFYDVLEVTSLADPEDLAAAVRVLEWRYGPARIARLDLGDAAPLAAPAWDLVERARKTLGNMAARGRYNDWLRERWGDLVTCWALDGLTARTASEAFGRGQQALADGDVHRALSEMATAARHHPGHPDYETGLAWTRYRVATSSGQDPAGVARRERAHAERATAGTRPWPRALLALALLCVADGDHEAARWHLREALAVDPGSPAARRLMARLGG